ATPGPVTLNAQHTSEPNTSSGFHAGAPPIGTLTDSQAVTLSINDVNEAPTVTSGASASVAENSPASTVVYTAAATDPDAGDSVKSGRASSRESGVSVDATTVGTTKNAAANGG